MNFEEYRSRESERIQANRKRMEEDGVIFQDIYNAYIDDSVVIEEGAFIACNVTLKGNTVIHREAFIGPGKCGDRCRNEGSDFVHSGQ